MSSSQVVLPGSERPAKAGTTKIGAAEPGSLVHLTVTIRGKSPLPEPGAQTKSIPIAELEERYGASSEDVALVAKTFSDLGLTVTAQSAGARTVELQGSVEHVEKVFGVELGIYSYPTDSKVFVQAPFRGREGVVHIPSALEGIVTGVFGLDERKVARRRPVTVARDAATAAPALTALNPSDFESRYSFPPGTAAGQVVGILEFGGGYFASDLQEFAAQISKSTAPTVNTISVGLSSLTLQQIQAIKNQQQQQNEFDSSIEVNMDIQVVAGLCPGATIQVYFAPFTQAGWVNVLNKAIHATNGPKVISVSWGAPEDTGDFTSSAIAAINNALQTAALAGVTVCISSGDDGAGDAANDGKAHLDFPASSPYTLAVGGTQIVPSGSGVVEQGWWESPGARTQNGGGASGGGRSTVFPTPSWQNVSVVSLRTNTAAGRAIPDVSALSGAPYYNLIFDGQVSPNGGTSASAPLWASLIARVAAELPAGKEVGFLTPKLYAPDASGNPLGASVTTDITSGHNDVLQSASTVAVTGYQAGPGYDAVTGWGVPNGTALLAALSS